jgi:DHA3 family macrolide efflux protein-like MFS transporter
MQGRVFGVQQLIMSTIFPLGMVVFGPIADVLSIEFLLVLSGALMAIPGAWIFFSRQPDKPPAVLPSADYEMQPGD